MVFVYLLNIVPSFFSVVFSRLIKYVGFCLEPKLMGSMRQPFLLNQFIAAIDVLN